MTFDKRTYGREYSRRIRAEKYAELSIGRIRCPFRLGPHECGGILETSIDRNGVALTWCPRCARREAGICQDCPRPVTGRVRSALRCAECRDRAIVGSQTRYQNRNLAVVRERGRKCKRAWRQQHPLESRRRARVYSKTHRAARTAYGRRWRAANLEKFRAQRRRYRRTLKARKRALARAA